MARDAATYLQKCLQCTVAEDRQPKKQALLEEVYPRRRLEQIDFDVQTITPRTSSDNIKIFAMVDVFTRFVRAKAIPDEKADTIARVLIEQWISIFGPMQQLLSDGGPNLIGSAIQELTAMLGSGRTQTYPLHPQANDTVERWNRTLVRDLSSFMATGEEDWDEHIALACFRYSTGLCATTGMTLYKAMFGAEAFDAWGEVDCGCFGDDPDSLAKRLALLHRQLLSKGKISRSRVKRQFDKRVNPDDYEVGERVLLWSVQISTQQGKKIFRPWLGPYIIFARIGRVGYELRAEVGDKNGQSTR